jgi:hypothetical protein
MIQNLTVYQRRIRGFFLSTWYTDTLVDGKVKLRYCPRDSNMLPAKIYSVERGTVKSDSFKSNLQLD